jgi:hypothetical protein
LQILSQTIEIGTQRIPGDTELIDTILHEELEARIERRALRRPNSKWARMAEQNEYGTHPYLLPVIDRYMRSKGWK